MIISKPITCILHTRHSHHSMAYFLYIFASKLIMFLRSVLINLSIPPSDPTPVYDHVSKSSMLAILQTALNTLILHTTNFKTGIDQGGIINPLDVLTKPLGWVLHSFHARRILEHYHSFILFIFYYLFDSYIDTFIVLLLKIREGVVLRTSPTYIHSTSVPSKGTNIFIYLVHLHSVSIFIPIGT